MSFFTRGQKVLAKKCSYSTLYNKYEKTEDELRRASYTGDEEKLKKAMAKHREIGYALLYRNTPEFKTKRKI